MRKESRSRKLLLWGKYGVVIMGKIGRRNIIYVGHLEIFIKIIKVAHKETNK